MFNKARSLLAAALVATLGPIAGTGARLNLDEIRSRGYREPESRRYRPRSKRAIIAREIPGERYVWPGQPGHKLAEKAAKGMVTKHSHR